MSLPREGRSGKDPANAAQGDGAFPLRGGRKEKDVFLDVGGEEQEVQDLLDAGPGDVRRACQVGVVADLAPVHEVLHSDGQGHEAGDAVSAGERRATVPVEQPAFQSMRGPLGGALGE